MCAQEVVRHCTHCKTLLEKPSGKNSFMQQEKLLERHHLTYLVGGLSTAKNVVESHGKKADWYSKVSRLGLPL